MAGDHHYEAPKTDGTFGLRVDWSKLSRSHISHTPEDQLAKQLPFKPKQPITAAELQQKTIRQWLAWRSWREASPFEQFSVSGQWQNYKVRHFSGKLPSSQFMAHLIIGLVTIGFITSYPKNSKHLYSQNH